MQPKIKVKDFNITTISVLHQLRTKMIQIIVPSMIHQTESIKHTLNMMQ